MDMTRVYRGPVSASLRLCQFRVKRWSGYLCEWMKGSIVRRQREQWITRSAQERPVQCDGSYFCLFDSMPADLRAETLV